MRLLLMADGLVGEQVARFVLEHYPEDVACVVSVAKNSIYEQSMSYNIPTYLFSSDLDIFSLLVDGDIAIDLGILAWWPFIVKMPLIKAPSLGFINFHPSLLPFNRGKNPNFWALVEQAPFGVSLHFAEETVDAGDIVAQTPIEYDWEDNGETLYKKALKEIVNLFCTVYPKIRTTEIPRQKQAPCAGSFHFSTEMLEISRINLNTTYTARQLFNLLRARTFQGYPSCRFEENGEEFEVRINIKRVRK